MNADEIIKILNHISSQFRSTLPKPVFRRDSFILGLKIASLIGLILFIIGCIWARKSYIHTRNQKPKTKITEYDKNEKIKSEKIMGDKKQTECKSIFVNGKLKFKECIQKINKNKWKGIFLLTILACIICFIYITLIISDAHYKLQLTFANPWHRAFARFFTKLFNVNDKSMNIAGNYLVSQK